MSQVHLGDDVIYDGKLCFVNNGVSAPTWIYAKPRSKRTAREIVIECMRIIFESVDVLQSQERLIFLASMVYELLV